MRARQRRHSGPHISPDSYEEIIASRGTIPDPTRLEELIALYLRDRRVAPTVSVVNGQQGRWTSRAAEVAATRQSAARVGSRQFHCRRHSSGAGEARLSFLKHVVKAEAKLAPFPAEHLEPWPSTGLRQIPATLPRESAADYEVILTWLGGLPLQMQESIAGRRLRPAQPARPSR
jgi:hypothetical protein